MGQTAKEILECFENSWGNYNPVLVGNTDTYVIGEQLDICTAANKTLYDLLFYFIQGGQNQSCPFLRAIILKLSSFDPMLVKPKCV